MTRILGMAMGPLVNILLGRIDTELTVFGNTIAVDSLNSVGLLLAFGNLLTVSVVWLLLDEPPEKKIKLPVPAGGAAPTRREDLWSSVLSIEILLPLFILLVVNSSFQL